MEFSVSQVRRTGFHVPVSEVRLDGRLVGYFYRDDTPEGEMWVAHTLGGHAANSKEEALRMIVEYAEAHPEHEIR